MKHAAPLLSMTATDAAFIYLERKQVPLHIASVCVFDGPIPYEQFVASINSKLHLVPRYLQIPVIPPWDLDFPAWRDDPHFDIHRHVIPVTLPAPGGEAELQALAGRILSPLLERDRPLWDVHVVSGLKDGRGALIWRLHHALADGVSGAELMRLLLDRTAEVPSTYPKPRYRRKRSAKARPPSTSGISDALNRTLKGLLGVEAEVLHLVKALLGDAQENPLKGLMGLLPEFTASIERLPFNKPCTGERRFCWTEFDLADVQAVRDSVGGTINDVILAVLTRALAQYVRLHGQSVVNRFARIVCPVSLHSRNEQNGLGNQISFLPVALPLDCRGPVRTLQAVTSRTETLKRSGALGFAALATKWLSATPPVLQALFWRNIPEVIFPVPLLNMICTNVVGSPTPLYAIGRRMLAAYPQVPTGWDLGVGCAAHSYDGKLFFGLLADTDAAPDVERLRDFLALSFHELRKSAALKKQRSRHRATRGATRKEQPAEPTRAAAPEPVHCESPPAPAADHSKEAA
jgi:diacylglycerol O-acyltransferase / wax synthase